MYPTTNTNPVPHPLLVYYDTLEDIRCRRVNFSSFQSMFEHLREIRKKAVDDMNCEEMTLLTSVTSDWLSALHPRLLHLVLHQWRLRLKSSSLASLQPSITAQMPFLLASLPDNPTDKLISCGTKDTIVQRLPTCLWVPILSLLTTKDLCALSNTCRYLREATDNPILWQHIRLRQSVLLLHGLPHFLSINKFGKVHSLDFSSVGLELDELKLLCQRCKTGALRYIDLSEKSFLGLDPNLMADSLGCVHSLRLRYCTFSNAQAVRLLRAVTRLQKVEWLDLLGSTVMERDLPRGPGAPHMSLMDCEKIHFSHLTSHQRDTLSSSFSILPEASLDSLTLDSCLLKTLQPVLLVENPGGGASLTTLFLSWAQWSTLLTHNISSNHLNQVSLEGSSCFPGPLRLPYTLLGESLATVTYLSISNLKTTSQQAVTMFNHMQLANKIKRLSLDSFVDLSQVKETLLFLHQVEEKRLTTVMCWLDQLAFSLSHIHIFTFTSGGREVPDSSDVKTGPAHTFTFSHSHFHFHIRWKRSA